MFQGDCGSGTGILGTAVEHCSCVSEADLAVGVPNGHPMLLT